MSFKQSPKSGNNDANDDLNRFETREENDHRPDGEQEEDKVSVDIELEELRRVRRALSKMNQGIENVQHQIKYFNSNVSQTTQLLDIWVRILSQTAHNQAFVANEDWQGGSMDSAKLEGLIRRDRERQEEANRRLREAEQQKAREVAEAKERERQRAELAAAAGTDTGNAQKGGGPLRQQAHTRSAGLFPGRRHLQPGGSTRVGAGRGREGAGASGLRGGRGRGSSIPPPTTGSRIPPRR
ncbi:hypothetical protein GGI25_002645 [Coemansia spiralis]|uniref:DASH complex subunit DUO1 n=2 Tax=Coemansia TaxID=4863 RepID=A0A9W8KYX1_9FUNG|nr:hypothetical protein EDC05_004451 [Coemansia umbellata]KAJ2620621.1 hypothetical protein GGI26_004853 [Coemansia sp. RSA 1358]KAJ2678141.1 hypothetical protein GGI25_002645 [Coemansia spiralis]